MPNSGNAYEQLQSTKFGENSRILGFDYNDLDIDLAKVILKNIDVHEHDISVYIANLNVLVVKTIKSCHSISGKSSQKKQSGRKDLHTYVQQLSRQLSILQFNIREYLHSTSYANHSIIFKLIRDINLLIQSNRKNTSGYNSMDNISDDEYKRLTNSGSYEGSLCLIKKKNYLSIAQLQLELVEANEKSSDQYKDLIHTIPMVINTIVCLQYKMITQISEMTEHSKYIHKHHYPEINLLLRDEICINSVTVAQANSIRWSPNEYWVLDILTMFLLPPLMANPNHLSYHITMEKDGKKHSQEIVGCKNPNQLSTIVIRDLICENIARNTHIKPETKTTILTALMLTFPNEVSIPATGYKAELVHPSIECYDDNYFAMLMNYYLQYHPSIAEFYVNHAKKSTNNLISYLSKQLQNTTEKKPDIIVQLERQKADATSKLNQIRIQRSALEKQSTTIRTKLEEIDAQLASSHTTTEVNKLLTSQQTDYLTQQSLIVDKTNACFEQEAVSQQRLGQLHSFLTNQVTSTQSSIDSSMKSKLIKSMKNIITVLSEYEQSHMLLPDTVDLRKNLVAALTLSHAKQSSNNYAQNWTRNIQLDSNQADLLELSPATNHSLLSTEVSKNNSIVLPQVPVNIIPIDPLIKSNLVSPSVSESDSSITISCLNPCHMSLFTADQTQTSTRPPIDSGLFNTILKMPSYGLMVSRWFGEHNTGKAIKIDRDKLEYVIPNGRIHNIVRTIDKRYYLEEDESTFSEAFSSVINEDYIPAITDKQLNEDLLNLTFHKIQIHSMVEDIIKSINKHENLNTIATQFHKAERNAIPIHRQVEQLRYHLSHNDISDYEYTAKLIEWRLEPYTHEDTRILIPIDRSDDNHRSEYHRIRSELASKRAEIYDQQIKSHIDTYQLLINKLISDGFFDRISEDFCKDDKLIDRHKQDFAICRLLAAFSDEAQNLEQNVITQSTQNYSYQQQSLFASSPFIPELIAKTQQFVCNIIDNYFAHLIYEDHCYFITNTDDPNSIEQFIGHTLNETIELDSTIIAKHTILTNEHIQAIQAKQGSVTISIAPGLIPASETYNDIFIGTKDSISPYEIKELLTTLALLSKSLAVYKSHFPGMQLNPLELQVNETITKLCYEGRNSLSLLGNLRKDNFERLHGSINEAHGRSQDMDPRTRDFSLLHHFIRLIEQSIGNVPTGTLIENINIKSTTAP